MQMHITHGLGTVSNKLVATEKVKNIKVKVERETIIKAKIRKCSRP